MNALHPWQGVRLLFVVHYSECAEIPLVSTPIRHAASCSLCHRNSPAYRPGMPVCSVYVSISHSQTGRFLASSSCTAGPEARLRVARTIDLG